MSELTLAVIKLGFLAALWLLILSVTSAMRADLFGVRPPKAPKENRDVRQARPATVQRRNARGDKNIPVRAVIVEGPDAGHEAPLTGEPVTFGRGAMCTMPLLDEYISTQHAQLKFYNGQWYVEDLGSTNGTYVGNQRITRSTPMNTKSKFRLGKTIVELRK